MATNRKTTNVTDLVKPTIEQKHEIYEMLKVSYDCERKRYTGVETDQSVALALGIKRWAWVQEIREQFFGPDGNEADQIAMSDIKVWLEKADKEIETLKAATVGMETNRASVQKLLAQVEALIKVRKPK